MRKKSKNIFRFLGKLQILRPENSWQIITFLLLTQNKKLRGLDTQAREQLANHIFFTFDPKKFKGLTF